MSSHGCPHEVFLDLPAADGRPGGLHCLQCGAAIPRTSSLKAVVPPRDEPDVYGGQVSLSFVDRGLALALVVALALLLTACGGGDPEDDAPDVPTPGVVCPASTPGCAR